MEGRKCTIDVRMESNHKRFETSELQVTVLTKSVGPDNDCSTKRSLELEFYFEFK